MAGSVALVVAGGSGSRFGGGTPKQYRLLEGRAILARSVAAFTEHPGIDAVRVVTRPDDRPWFDSAVAGLALLDPVEGGATRQESVRRGLESLSTLSPRHVLIHDAARPLVDGATISRVLAALDRSTGAIAAIPVTDALKRTEGDRISGSIHRAGLWRAQTPQGFHFEEILAAHRAAAGTDLLDDAAVAERAGMGVSVVMGNDENIKITSEEDFARAASILLSRTGEVRVGTGFDVHALVPGDHIMLCGVAIPHDHRLEGHSDSDVGLHALTDAILGAIGAEDIGAHFPPSDPRWAGASSEIFLRHAGDLVTARGGSIAHVDVTLICERPRLAPHRATMRARIAKILSISIERVSVKATTTEGLGFAGRSEGIAAQAAATVRLPSGVS